MHLIFIPSILSVLELKQFYTKPLVTNRMYMFAPSFIRCMLKVGKSTLVKSQKVK